MPGLLRSKLLDQPQAENLVNGGKNLVTKPSQTQEAMEKRLQTIDDKFAAREANFAQRTNNNQSANHP